MEIKNTGRIVLSSSPILEFFTRTHISVPLIIFFGTSVLVTLFIIWQYALTFETVALLLLSGIITFSFVEYVVHRFVFHMPTYSRLSDRIQYFIHGIHHEYPRDKMRLAMPPVASVSIAIVLFTLFWFTADAEGLVFGCGFVAGYAGYLCVHYAVHALRPPRNFLRILWRNHSIHHYKDHEVAYGVSTPLWDMVFQTLPGSENKRK